MNKIEIKINEWEGKLIQRDQKTFQDVINFPNKLNAEIVNLMGRIDGHDPKITKGSLTRMDDLMAEWNNLRSLKEEIIEVDIKEFNDAFVKSGLSPIVFPKN